MEGYDVGKELKAWCGHEDPQIHEFGIQIEEGFTFLEDV
jgi:hypothetical protein